MRGLYSCVSGDWQLVLEVTSGRGEGWVGEYLVLKEQYHH